MTKKTNKPYFINGIILFYDLCSKKIELKYAKELKIGQFMNIDVAIKLEYSYKYGSQVSCLPVRLPQGNQEKRGEKGGGKVGKMGFTRKN